jgi:hypothetical protein
MSGTCLSCHVSFGRNADVEQLPVGRRLAFDSHRGRLWIICWRCGTWNLTPVETRWEAIEECERRYRSTAERYSTSHIGIARLPGGLQLVRIGKPPTQEFAAWRYGRRFAQRRNLFWSRVGVGSLGAGALAVGTGALLTAGAGLGVILSGYGFASAWLWRRRDPYVARIPSTIQAAFPLRQWDLRFLRIARKESGWAPDTQQDREFTGAKAMLGLSLVLPLMNRWGGSARLRAEAVRLLDDAGGPERFTDNLRDRHFETIATFSRRTPCPGDGHE